MLALVLAVTLAAATPEEAAPPGVMTAEFIQKLHPQVSWDRALKLGQTIRTWADHYSVDPLLIAAIVKQESDFRSGLKSCNVVLRYEACFVTCDYGVAQVNALWIDKWKLDANRLRHDDSYNIKVAARILAALRKEFEERDPEWYGRYHSGTPSKKAVYLGKLEPLLAMR